MPELLMDLGRRKDALCGKTTSLGDFRRGGIPVNCCTREARLRLRPGEAPRPRAALFMDNNDETILPEWPL